MIRNTQRALGLASLALVFLAAHAPRSHGQTVIGNWESGASEGWFDWWGSPGNAPGVFAPPRLDFNSIGATLGTKAVQFTIPTPSTYTQWMAIKLQMGAAGPPGPPNWENGLAEWRDEFMSSSKLAFDLTLVGSEMSQDPANNYATINPVVNADGFGFNAIPTHLESITNNDDFLFPATGDRHSFNPLRVVGTRTFTITYDISFTHDEGGVGAAGTEIAANPNYVELLFEAYTNGPVVYHVDNVRLFTPSLTGDFDNDTDVDRDDLVNKWQAGFGLTGQTDDSNGDADGDGDVDGNDFVLWQRNIGATPLNVGALGAIPEPAAGLLSMFALAYLGGVRRRLNRVHK